MIPYGFKPRHRSGEHHMIFAGIAVLLSAVLHCFVMFYCANWPLRVVTGGRIRIQPVFGFDRIPPMHVETLHADPMRLAQKVKGERDTPSRGPVDVSDRVEMLRQPAPPALTAPPPIPREALTPGALALKEAQTGKIDPTPWMPRQEIQQIYDRTVRDEVAAFPRREIPLIERIEKAPDVVPSIDLAGRRFGKDPEPPRPFESAEIFDTRIVQGTFTVPALDAPIDANTISATATGEKFAVKPGEKSGKVFDTGGTEKQEQKQEQGQESKQAKTSADIRPPPVSANPAERRARETQKEIARIHENIDFVPIDDLLAVGMEIYRDPDEPGKTYFRIEIQPRGGKPVPVIPKDIVFVQDVSGSMTEERMVFCRRAVSAALQTLNTGDRFNIVAFRDTFEYCFPEWAAATAPNIRKARAFIDGMRAFGKTDIFGSLKALVQLPRDPRRPMIAFVVTDGKPTAGLVESTAIISDFSALNNGLISIYMYGIQSSANAYLLDMITYCNRGAAAILSGNRWEIPASMAESYESIRNPIMGDITVAFNSASQSEVYPRECANLYRDRQLELCGVCPDSTRELVFQIRGLAAEKGYDSIFRLDIARQAKRGGKLVKDRWIRQKMYYLVSEYSRRPREETMAEMVKLNKRYGVTIPYKKELK